jgi:putative ABC transport system permease protein
MVGDLGRQAFNALQHNRRRSLLTMLGMAWGIATVVLLLAYGTGFQNALMIAFRTFGGNLVGIFPGRTSVQAGGTKAGAQVRLTREDLDYLRAEVPMLTRISPEVDKQSLVSVGTRSTTYGIHGVYSSYEKIRALEVGEGAFFGEQEDFTHSRVAVIGSTVKKKLFSGQNALGESVRIDGISYKVIAVLKHTISNSDEDMNSLVYVPYSAMSDLKNSYYLDGIFMDYEGDHTKTTEAVRNSMAFHLCFRRGERSCRLDGDHGGHQASARIYRPVDTRNRWRWTDEHHAGVRNAANAGDRRREGPGGTALAYSLPVSRRGPGDYRAGRALGRGFGISGFMVSRVANLVERVY